MKNWVIFLWIAFLVAIDQGSEVWARRTLLMGHPRPVVGSILMVHLLFNQGAMLGLGSRYPAIVLWVGLVMTTGLLIAVFRVPSYRWPLATMAGGALGNVISRLIYGRVTDFIQLRGYPGIFNLSDVALRAGVVWLIVVLLFGRAGSHQKG